MKSNKEIIKFALPAIIENFLQMFVGFSDTFLVARIGLNAVAAVSLANNIITVYQAIFIALGTIVSSLFARKLAEKNKQEIQQLVNSAFKLTLWVSLLLGLFSLFGGGFATYLLGARGHVQSLAVLYLALVGGSIVLLALMTTLGSFLRAKGNTQTPMWASLLANLLNLIFSASLIFGLHLGVLGAAIGTISARLLATIYLYFKVAEHPTADFLRQKLQPELISLTLPATGERLAMRLGDLLIMALIISLGSRVYAGNAIGESITQFNYMPVFGMATVTVILVAQEFGQKNLAAIKTYIRRTYSLASLMMLLIGLGLWLNSHWLNLLFTNDKIAQNSSDVVILFSLLATFFVVGTTTYTAAFQGIGNARLPFYTTSFGMLVIRIGLGALLGIVFQLGLTGVWTAILLDNLFRFVFLKMMFKKSESSILK